jgi:phage terminase small subunit
LKTILSESVNITTPEIKQETSANLAPLSSVELTPIEPLAKTEENNVQILHDKEIKQVKITDVEDINGIKLPQLVQKQVKFCEGILSGETQSKAYINAGYKPKNEHTASVKASNLLDIGDIKLYLEIRRKQIDGELRKQAYVTKEWALLELIASVQRCKINDKERDLQNAIAGIREMLGYNAPIAQIITDSRPIADYSKVPADRLKQLTDALHSVEEFTTGKKTTDNGKKSAQVLKLVDKKAV